MKSILVPIEITDAMQPALETALLLARHREAYIEGFPLRFGISEFATAEVVGGFPSEAYRQYGVQEAEQTQKLFENFMQERGVPRAGESLGLAYGWLEDAPEGEGFVGSYGRAFDVTVLSRPDSNSIGLHTRAIESSLFESGRPLLLAPPRPPKTIATNIMIHWNGSTEQARANAFAMPLLRAAERVSVLTVVGGQGVAGPAPADIVKQLKRNGIAAKPIRVEIDNRNTGEAVLAAAKAEGCDLLVKGAFTRSRLRQMVFGGATSHIMAHADLPVLMAH
jgi:nucleotide-binding universal stress UspA family protein